MSGEILHTTGFFADYFSPNDLAAGRARAAPTVLCLGRVAQPARRAASLAPTDWLRVRQSRALLNRQVRALYESVLGHDPDFAGFTSWTGAGSAGLGQRLDSLLTSPEAFNSDLAVVTAYQAATGAPPTYAQFTAVLAQLCAGAANLPMIFYSAIPRHTVSRISTGTCSSASPPQPRSAPPIRTISPALPQRARPQQRPLHRPALLRDSQPRPGPGFRFWLGVANQGGPWHSFPERRRISHAHPDPRARHPRTRLRRKPGIPRTLPITPEFTNPAVEVC